jgi:uncharacterized membrane protein
MRCKLVEIVGYVARMTLRLECFPVCSFLFLSSLSEVIPWLCVGGHIRVCFVVCDWHRPSGSYYVLCTLYVLYILFLHRQTITGICLLILEKIVVRYQQDAHSI